MRILLRLFRPTTTMPALGRWRINYTPEVLTLKINQANEDHCGCCEKADTYLEPFVLY